MKLKDLKPGLVVAVRVEGKHYRGVVVSTPGRRALITVDNVKPPRECLPQAVLCPWDEWQQRVNEAKKTTKSKERRDSEESARAHKRFQDIMDALAARGLTKGLYTDRRHKRISGVAMDFDTAERIVAMLGMIPSGFKWVDE